MTFRIIILAMATWVHFSKAQFSPTRFRQVSWALGLSTLVLAGCGATSSDSGREVVNRPARPTDEDAGVNPREPGSADAGNVASQNSSSPTSGTTDPPISSAPTPPSMGSAPTMTPPTPPSMTGRPSMMVPPIGMPTPPSSGPLISALVNCGEPELNEQDTYCEATLTCDNDSLVAYCSPDGNGALSCYCKDFYSSQSFTLEASDSSCLDSLAVCSPGLSPPSEQDCDADSLYVSPSYCSSSRNCRKRIELESGAQAELTEYQNASCQPLEDGVIACNCSVGGATRYYELRNGTTLDDSCTEALDLCATTPSPSFLADPDCTEQYSTRSPADCQFGAACRYEAETAEGVVAVFTSNPNSYCYDQGNGTWSCYCSTANQSLGFQLDAAQVNDEVCTNAFAACEELDPATLERTSCSQVSQTAGGSYCTAQIQCDHEASAAGLSFVVSGYLSASCNSTAEGSYDCTCSGATTSTPQTILAESAWNACEQASKLCPDLVPAIGSGVTSGPPMGK